MRIIGLVITFVFPKIKVGRAAFTTPVIPIRGQIPDECSQRKKSILDKELMINAL